MRWQKFVQTQLDGGAVGVIGEAQPRVARYAALEGECQALDAGPALVDRAYRALLEVTGADRATWLHNLTTNQVKNLGRGEGNYAFVLNIQGRILFDVNLLVRADSIWLDLDRRFLETAKKHFAKYIITEDVAVADRSDEFVRFGLVGAKAASLLSKLGAANAPAIPTLGLSQIEWRGAVIPLIRHDFCGPFAVELFVPAESAVDFWRAHVDSGKAVPVGDEAVQVRRIEAGIPWPGHEITDEYLPAETRQLDRAVNFQKGCYLGQEVVERMRSRHVVARQLVGLRLEGSAVPPLKSQIFTPSPSEGEGRGEGPKPIGQVTSACHSPTLGCPIALAYVKSALSRTGSRFNVAHDGGGMLSTTVVDLPYRAPA
jgi:folate-binding protein YgfZ